MSSTHSEVRTRRWKPRRLAFQGVGLVVLAVAVTGCTKGEVLRLGMPEPITTQAETILSLWQGSWIAAFCVGALVWGLIFWASLFHRKRSDQLPPQVRYNLPIEVLYMVVPFIMVLVLFYFSVKDESEINHLSKNPDVVVNVVGFQWSWEFNYPQRDVTVVGHTGGKPTLVIPAHRTVRFNLTSADVIHSFWVPAFLFHRDVNPGHPNHFEVTPTREGTFAGKCAELCGAYHDRMLFRVRVVSPQEFQAFIASHHKKSLAGGTK
ncbi:MAG: aa3-type cytochrome oxidase subunit II [Streptosporangiaceae bacterium]